VEELKAWLATVNPDEYEQDAPWSAEVLAAYENYKALAEKFATAHQSFLRNRQQSFKNATPEEHLERARLAVTWGELAVRCVILMLHRTLANRLLSVSLEQPRDGYRL
jgi:hypothetical protein